MQRNKQGTLCCRNRGCRDGRGQHDVRPAVSELCPRGHTRPARKAVVRRRLEHELLYHPRSCWSGSGLHCWLRVPGPPERWLVPRCQTLPLRLPHRGPAVSTKNVTPPAPGGIRKVSDKAAEYHQSGSTSLREKSLSSLGLVVVRRHAWGRYLVCHPSAEAHSGADSNDWGSLSTTRSRNDITKLVNSLASARLSHSSHAISPSRQS